MTVKIFQIKKDALLLHFVEASSWDSFAALREHVEWLFKDQFLAYNVAAYVIEIDDQSVIVLSQDPIIRPVINPEWEKLGPGANIFPTMDQYKAINIGPPTPIPDARRKRFDLYTKGWRHGAGGHPIGPALDADDDYNDGYKTGQMERRRRSEWAQKRYSVHLNEIKANLL